jgi:hypothetical protein
MGVDLRGRKVAVSEQHLYHAQVRAVVEQVHRMVCSDAQRSVQLENANGSVYERKLPKRLSGEGCAYVANITTS